MDTLPTHTAPPRAKPRPWRYVAALCAMALIGAVALLGPGANAPSESGESTARAFEATKLWLAGDKEGAKRVAGEKASNAKQAVIDAKTEYDEFQEWKKTHPRDYQINLLKGEAPPKEKVGWMPFAQAGAETGGNFMQQGLDTSFRFFTDPNFDFQKEGEAYVASSQATASKFGAIEFSENKTVGDEAYAAASLAKAKYAEHQKAEADAASYTEEVRTDAAATAQTAVPAATAAAPTEKIGALGGEKSAEAAPAAEGAKARGGWMPFAQQGAATGGNFMQQGLDTGLRFFTDPNFDFQKEGEAYQASGAATGNAFGGLSQGMLPTSGGADGAAAAEGETPASASARRFDAVRKWKAGDKDGAKATASENAAAAAQKAKDAKAEYDAFQEYKASHGK